MSRTWCKNWPDKVRELATRQGYTDVFDFVMSHPGESFGQLYKRLQSASEQSEFTPAFSQIAEVFYLDADRQGRLRDAFAEALVRAIRQFLKKGWGVGKQLRQRRIQAQTHWPSPSLVDSIKMSHEDWFNLQEFIWHELERESPAAEWCPADYRDPVIQAVFDRVWPIGAESHDLKREVQAAIATGRIQPWDQPARQS
ncbi:MAG: hypothetical protein KatS3mg111_3390 [Pirellulaceae bacterium]|nr:MAG: hypothetical protein KatS3mg111_3390 [Pirellulaceae bacterium]